MSLDLIGRTTQASALKTNLDGISKRVRGIADRVANAGDGAAAFSFPGEAGATGAAGSPIDIESEMASLADEQLRFDATARLLQKTYAGLRASLRDR